MRNPVALLEEDSAELDCSPFHTNEARNGTKRPDGQRLAMLDSEGSEEELPESIQAMQRGPGIIVDTLNEIDALISNPRSAPAGARRDHRTPATVHDIVREYDLSLETGLPLSRTTDSWGDDPEDDHRDEPVSSSPRSREPRLSNPNDAYRLRRGEHATELGTIRESRFSSVSTNTNQLYQINEECDTSISSAHTGETLYSSRARHHAREPPDNLVLAARTFVDRGSTEVGRNSVDPSNRSAQPSTGFENSNQREELPTPRRAGEARGEALNGARGTDGNDEVLFSKSGLSSPTRSQRWNDDSYVTSRQSPSAKKSTAPGKSSGTFPRELFSEDMETSNNAPTQGVGSQRILPRRSVRAELECDVWWLSAPLDFRMLIHCSRMCRRRKRASRVCRSIRARYGDSCSSRCVGLVHERLTFRVGVAVVAPVPTPSLHCRGDHDRADRVFKRKRCGRTNLRVPFAAKHGMPAVLRLAGGLGAASESVECVLRDAQGSHSRSRGWHLPVSRSRYQGFVLSV